LLEITAADLQAYLPAAKAKSTPTSFKRFVRFLAETERMEFEQSHTNLPSKGQFSFVGAAASKLPMLAYPTAPHGQGRAAAPTDAIWYQTLLQVLKRG
jgi:hypothetical protein